MIRRVSAAGKSSSYAARNYFGIKIPYHPRAVHAVSERCTHCYRLVNQELSHLTAAKVGSFKTSVLGQWFNNRRGTDRICGGHSRLSDTGL